MVKDFQTNSESISWVGGLLTWSGSAAVPSFIFHQFNLIKWCVIKHIVVWFVLNHIVDHIVNHEVKSRHFLQCGCFDFFPTIFRHQLFLSGAYGYYKAGSLCGHPAWATGRSQLELPVLPTTWERLKHGIWVCTMDFFWGKTWKSPVPQRKSSSGNQTWQLKILHKSGFLNGKRHRTEWGIFEPNMLTTRG